MCMHVLLLAHFSLRFFSLLFIVVLYHGMSVFPIFFRHVSTSAEVQMVCVYVLHSTSTTLSAVFNMDVFQVDFHCFLCSAVHAPDNCSIAFAIFILNCIGMLFVLFRLHFPSTITHFSVSAFTQQYY